MDCRCLLFDLDGTLLRSDKSISTRTLRALEACRERGVKIGISTNRSENRAKPFLDQLGPEVIISSGGALVRWDGEIVFRAEFSPGETRRVLDLIREVCGAEAKITMDTADAHYWNRRAEPGQMDNSWADTIYCDFAQYHGEALKISASITDETFPLLKSALPDCDCLRHTEADWCKITKANATKESALRELCRVSGLSLAEIAAFGDDTPDIGMLRLCGLGIAMGNAVPAVKAAADMVIGTNDEDGIADWLEEQRFFASWQANELNDQPFMEGFDMEEFTISEMKDMQRQLQEKYKDKWEGVSPEVGKNQLLWMIGEIGEVIDIIKKQGSNAIMEDPAVRAHFVEEMADVLMFYSDVLLCFDIPEEDLKRAYTEKFQRNMNRW